MSQALWHTLTALAVTVGIATAGCQPPIEDEDEDDDVQEPDPIWDGFVDERDEHLAALAVPIADCVSRTDTLWPVFSGCYDWHSSVHGNYALHAVTRLTGDPSYRELAEVKLTADGLQQELDNLADGTLDPQELPYGYAWFLALARERERAGADDLVPLAEEVADRLEAHLQGLAPMSWDSRVVAAQYRNVSWEILNLWAWAEWTGDAERAAWVVDLVRDELVPRSDLCPLTDEPGYVSEFFPPCLHLARTVLTVLPPQEAGDWAAEHVPSDLELLPLVEFPTAHPAGLNFSRAWGLWTLWEATGDLRWRDRYVDHVLTHVEQPEYWADDYLYYAHWVAQFGVYAIALSYGEAGAVP